MGLTFFELYRRLHEVDAPTTPPPAPTGGNPMPPPAGGNVDPLMGGGMPPASSDPSMGGMPPASGGPTGKPKVIKITTVWDALENVLGGKINKPKTSENPSKKEEKQNKSLHT